MSASSKIADSCAADLSLEKNNLPRRETEASQTFPGIAPDYYKNPLLGRNSVGQFLLRPGLMGFSNLVWAAGDWRGLASPFFRVGREFPISLECEPEYLKQTSQNSELQIALCGPDSWAIQLDLSKGTGVYGGAPGKIHHCGGTAQQQWMAFDPFRDGATLESREEGVLISSNGSYLAAFVGPGLELAESGNGWQALLEVGAHKFGVGLSMGDEEVAIERARQAIGAISGPGGMDAVRARLSAQWLGILRRFRLQEFGDAEDVPFAANAVWCIYSNLVAAEGFLTRPAVLGAKIQYPAVFPWDSVFASLALHVADPELARDQIELYTDKMTEQRPEGPGIFHSLKNNGGMQLPFFSLASWRIYSAREDKEFLQRVYPRLSRSAEWWSTEFATQDNIPCYHEVVCYDDSPRFDVFSSQGRMSLEEPVLGADLIAICAMDKMYLAKMAQVLGFADEAETHLRDARRIVEFMDARLYDEQLGRYVDVGVHSGKVGSVNTPMGHFPAFLSANPRRRTAAVQALSPGGPFWGKFGLTTVSPEESAFDPCRIWRGPIWLSVNFLCAYSCAAMGALDVSDEIAKTSLDVIRANDPLPAGFMEYFNYQTGAGSGAHHIATMSAAPYLAMFLGYHRLGTDVSAMHLHS